MVTVALRYAEKFAPEGGTIKAHQDVIDENGFVWYGKIGQPLSGKTCELFEEYFSENQEAKILLIHSGGTKRYWAYIDKVQRDKPKEDYPQYYGTLSCEMKTWFRVVRFELAPPNVMSTCRVKSSGASLSEVSKHSMSPFFIIECD